MNLVAHFKEGTSDKVYIVSVYKDGSSYPVRARWGRRNGTMQEMVKSRHDTMTSAEVAARRLFREKTDKGYEDITGSNYHNGLKMTDPWLVKNLHSAATSTSATAAAPAAPTPPKPAPSAPREAELFCMDATGMEAEFDEGLEYVTITHDDPQMIWAFDRNGVKVEKFRCRFGTANEYSLLVAKRNQAKALRAPVPAMATA